MGIEAGSHFSDDELFDGLNVPSPAGESRFKPHSDGVTPPTEVEIGRGMLQGALQIEADIDAFLAAEGL